MAYLSINNLKFKDYQINTEFLDLQVIGVFALDSTLRTDFLKLLAGINRNQGTCFYRQRDIFDNEEYFNSRIYLDYAHIYLSTLRTANIEKSLKTRYNLSFNKEIFVKIAKELNVRGETEITHIYNFTPAGNTFVNYALTAAVEKPNIIINNPTIGLNQEMDINYLVNSLSSHKTDGNIILGLNRLKDFRGKLDRIFIFTDCGQTYSIDSAATVFVSKEDVETDYRLFVSDYYLSLNLFSKDELKRFQKNKIEYKIISIYDIEDYL